jgi:hypothetical protein
MQKCIPAMQRIGHNSAANGAHSGAIDKPGTKPMTDQPKPISRKQLDEILETQGYEAAKAAADKAGIIWYASAGAKRK